MMLRLTRTPHHLWDRPANPAVANVCGGVQIRVGLIGMMLIPLTILSSGGCARFDLRKNIPWQETSSKPVQSVVVFWTDALIERRSGPPYRGFGGRVYFYPADMSRPVKVRGTLVVYAFDDNLPPPENLKPVRKFVFTNEQLEKVYADSKLGPSYNILIPWDEYSPTSQRISLIARFIPEEGPSVVSEQARVFLPGFESGFLAAQSPSPRSDAPAKASEMPNHSAGGAPVAAQGDAGSTLPAVFAREHAPRASAAQQSPTKGETTGPEGGSSVQPVSQRRMQTLTLNISSRRPTPMPSQGADPENPGKQETSTSRGSEEQNGIFQDAPALPKNAPEEMPLQPEPAGNTKRDAAATDPRGWTPVGSPLQYVPPPSPPSAGQLIDQMNLRPPARSELYPPQVREAGAVPIPAGR